MKISELSRRSGFPASTLRFYESEGLLPVSRSANGYRDYGEADVDRLAFIAQAKDLDLPLAAVRTLVRAWESEPCQDVRAKYRPVLLEHASRVDDRIISLEALRSTLDTALERLDELPDREQPCDAGCAFLDRTPRTAPVVAEHHPPLACSLDGADYGARVTQWRDLFTGSSWVEVADGVRVTLPITALRQTAALAQAEQVCCAFYGFQIDLHGPTLDLTITAPPEARQMLEDLLPTQEAAR
ncbi:MerR family transcriptional regulator [Serinicoccus kebangsaanensis]|uniref:MerR family transcriptional regulator n=1 Tax=Serinicoccus kebangsaanensis TaxID=2602069 RepID=UPI00124E1862|nr:MerR family transcriptional regulator [Serinicoccus kebangsaanensis]